MTVTQHALTMSLKKVRGKRHAVIKCAVSVST